MDSKVEYFVNNPRKLCEREGLRETKGKERPREKMLNDLASWHRGISEKIVVCAQDRGRWTDMIANVT